MTASKSPFTFDPDQFREMFKVPEFEKLFAGAQIPGVDLDAIMAAQQKNVDALAEANKIAMAGYQEVFQRQVVLLETAISEAQKQIGSADAAALTPEQAKKNMEALRAAVEKAITDARELAELTQQANTNALDVVKGRFEEALAEVQDAAAKIGK